MKNHVQSIERAFRILRVVHQRGDGVGIGALAEETGLHTSTTSRIVSTLEHLGALDRQGSQLIIGDEIVNLANQAPWSEQLIRLAIPSLRDLAAETQEAVGLTMITGAECLVFYQIPSSHHIQIRDWTGERFPLHVTSSGKLYLAGLPEQEVSAQLSAPLSRFTKATKDQLADLQAEFPSIRANGVAWTLDELEEGLTSIAAPIYDAAGQFYAGLYISIPNYRLSDKQHLAQQMRRAAAEISARLGYEDD